MKKLSLLLSALFLFGIGVFAQPKLSENNIQEIVRVMSPEEKACLVVGLSLIHI